LPSTLTTAADKVTTLSTVTISGPDAVTIFKPSVTTVTFHVSNTCPVDVQTVTLFTTIPADEAAYTSTQPGFGTVPGTIYIGIPSGGTLTRTTTIPAGEAAFTSTQPAVGTVPGTVLVGLPGAGTVTTTTTIAAGQNGFTSTIPAAGTTSGTVLIGTPSSAIVTITTTLAPAQFTQGMCVNDSSSGRALLNQVYLDPAYNNQTNSPAQCADFCYQQGYSYSGTEYTYQCFCGDAIYQYYSGDIKFSGFPVFANTIQENPKNTFCNRTCPADKTQLCGGFGGLELASAAPSATAA